MGKLFLKLAIRWGECYEENNFSLLLYCGAAFAVFLQSYFQRKDRYRYFGVRECMGDFLPQLWKFLGAVSEDARKSWRSIVSKPSDSDQIVGDGWQVELKVKYDKAAFDAEVERISKLTEGSPVHGKSEYFSLPTYASVWNGESRCSFEYAVVREEENTISYIYLQQLYESDFSISSDCIPRNYKYPSEYKEKTFLISNYPDIHSW